jgi:hypothetical protein
MKRLLNSLKPFRYWMSSIFLVLYVTWILTIIVNVPSKQIKKSDKYKYEIYTQHAVYFTDSIEHAPNGETGFHNSNGTYIQIR